MHFTLYMVEKLEYDGLVKTFATLKARRKWFT